MGYLLRQSVEPRGRFRTRTEEWDTTWCRHCQAVVRRITATTEGAWCPRCHGPVCLPCGRRAICTPFVRQVDDAIRRVAQARAMGLQGVSG